ncbi:MAG: hypothetical protein ABR575_04410 [Actinomycetota bacterium]
MKRNRVALGVFVVSTLAAWAIGPFTASAKDVTTGVGTTSTSLQLVDVSLTEVPALGTLNAALGLASTDATTVDDTLASVLFTGATIAGQSSGSEGVSSSDGVDSKNVSVPLSGPGIDGSLTIAEMRAEATSDSATALLNALEGQVDVALLGLSATTGANGTTSRVVPKIAESRTGASLGPVELTLGDLLPADLLDALPLSAVLDLIDGLDLDLGAVLSGQIDALRDLLTTLDTLQDKVDELAGAQDQLLDLVGGNTALLGQIDAAQQTVSDAAAAVDAAEVAVTDAQAAVAAAQTTLDGLNADKAALEAEKAALEALLAECPDPTTCAALQSQIDAIDAEIAAVDAQIVTAQATLDAAQADLAAAQADVTAAQTTLDTAQAELDALLAGLDAGAIQTLQDTIDSLQAQIDALLVTVEDLLGQLPDLTALIDQVLALLADAPLVAVGALNVSVESAADAVKGTADVSCGATGVSVLGQSLGALSCAELSRQFDDLAGGILDVLQSLPVAVTAVPEVTVDGLKATTSASKGPDAQRRTSASASLSALEIGVPSVELGAMVDGLVQDALAEIETIVAGLPAGSTEVQALLNTLKAQLEALPTGQALDGLNTVGVDAVLGGLISRSSFQADPGDNAEPPSTRPPTEPGDPSDPPAAAPLPFTGPATPIALPIAVAMWLMMAGALLAFFSERTGAGVRETTR